MSLTGNLRMYYVDDSGSVDTGHIVYSWIETTPAEWRTALAALLAFRKSLYATHKVPPSKELHAAHLVGGRGNPSTDPAVNRSKALRREVMTSTLKTIGTIPQIRIGTVYRTTTAIGSAYAAERAHLYDALVDRLDKRLAAAEELGMIHMDGNGSDLAYFQAHRRMKLEDRSIIEDPVFQDSGRSQFVQMADLTAWTAYQAVQKRPTKPYAKGWYDIYLKAADPDGGPVTC